MTVDEAVREFGSTTPPLEEAQQRLWRDIVTSWGIPRSATPEAFRWCAYAVTGLVDFIRHSSVHTADELRAADGPLLKSQLDHVATLCNWNVITHHGVRAALQRARTHPDVDRDLRFQTHLHAIPLAFLQAHPRLWD